MFGLEHKVEKAARKAAAFSVAALLGSAGAGFLTTAAWLALAEARSATFASIIVGLAYLGCAAIATAIGLSRRARQSSSRPTTAADQLSPMQTVVVSFLQGFEQGRQARRP